MPVAPAAPDGPAALEPLLTTAQACDHFHVTSETLAAWRRDGLLPAVQIGARVIRYRRRDIEQLIADHLVGADREAA